MKKSSLIVLTAFLIVIFGCERQEPELVFLNENFITASPGTDTMVYTKHFTAGIDKDTVPMKCTWKVAKTENCLKIASLKVERTGGNPNVIVKNVRYHFDRSCVMDLNNDTTKFQGLIVFYDSKYKKMFLFGFEQYGMNVGIDGKGRTH